MTQAPMLFHIVGIQSGDVHIVNTYRLCSANIKVWTSVQQTNSGHISIANNSNICKYPTV